MSHVTHRRNALRGFILPGENTYRDPLDGTPQPVFVERIEGPAWVTFLDVHDEDEGLMVDAWDLAGTFDRVL